MIATLLLLRPDWLTWYGVHGWLGLPTALKLEPGNRLNLFSVLPQSNAWIEALFWVALGSTILLTLGLFTRLNSVLVLNCLTSIQQRNLYITHGGDTFLRLAGFFLIFAPAGAPFSVDRLIRLRRGKESPTIQPRSPWAQRMIQLQLSLSLLGHISIEDKGGSLASWNCAVLRVPSRRTQAISSTCLVFLANHSQAGKLVGFSSRILSWGSDLGKRFTVSAAGARIPVSSLARVFTEHSALPVGHSLGIRFIRRAG